MFYVKDESGRIIETASSPDSFADNMKNCIPAVEKYTVHEDTDENVRALQEQGDIDNLSVGGKALLAIRRLESTVTQRRIRAMTTVAGAKWVDDVEKLIAIERAKL